VLPRQELLLKEGGCCKKEGGGGEAGEKALLEKARFKGNRDLRLQISAP